MAMTTCLSSSTLLHSPEQWRRTFFRLSSTRDQRVLSAVRARPSISIVLRASAADGAQLTENKKEDKEEEEKALQQRLQALASSMVLPANFLSQLPNDLRSDREPFAAIGKRLIGAGRRFAGTGSYAKGELQAIAKALTVAGEAMQSADETQTKEESELQTARMYKFGDLQVEFTSQKCFIGSIIALGFGALSWGLATSVQGIPDSASQHANDNATLLATSLKGAFLLLGYGCTLLSGLAVIGLLGLGLQLSAKSSTEK
ncbi:hypothetical protein L7F22_038443 [Adiantum nelumboides]|nr:hypothetical protein [Adiantum nelumboides]